MVGSSSSSPWCTRLCIYSTSVSKRMIMLVINGIDEDNSNVNDSDNDINSNDNRKRNDDKDE